MPVKRLTCLRLLLPCVALAASLAHAQPTGKLRCEAEENGVPAAASFRALKDGAAIASGACGKDATLPLGAVTLEIALDGVLAARAHKFALEVSAQGTARARASFETGTLLVEVTRDGRRGAATVKLLDDGRELAQLGAGVASRVAVGTYALEIESRGERRRMDGVSITRGERRVVGVDLAGSAK